jgi:hypothetical protein
MKDLWFKLNLLHQELVNLYRAFSLKRRQEFLKDFNISSGTDYAGHIFNKAELEDA